VAVLLVLDNVSYNAFTSGDSIIPYRKGKFRKYHVDGDVLLAPPELLEPFLRNCLQIFQALPDQLKWVLVPLPRYPTAAGCPDPEHASNRLQDFYRKTIIGRLERLKKSIRDFLLSSGIRNLKVITPLPVADSWSENWGCRPAGVH
jgi:hypothetical protein